jgi:hypothetical protein
MLAILVTLNGYVDVLPFAQGLSEQGGENLADKFMLFLRMVDLILIPELNQNCRRWYATENYNSLFFI